MDENTWSNDPDKRLVFRASLKENKLRYETTPQNSKQNDWQLKTFQDWIENPNLSTPIISRYGECSQITQTLKYHSPALEKNYYISVTRNSTALSEQI